MARWRRGAARVACTCGVSRSLGCLTCSIMTRPGSLTDAEQARLDAILAASPELAAVTASARALAAMMNERRGRKLLESWMTDALRRRRAGAALLRHRPQGRPRRRRHRPQPPLDLS